MKNELDFPTAFLRILKESVAALAIMWLATGCAAVKPSAETQAGARNPTLISSTSAPKNTRVTSPAELAGTWVGFNSNSDGVKAKGTLIIAADGRTATLTAEATGNLYPASRWATEFWLPPYNQPSHVYSRFVDDLAALRVSGEMLSATVERVQLVAWEPKEMPRDLALRSPLAKLFSSLTGKQIAYSIRGDRLINDQGVNFIRVRR